MVLSWLWAWFMVPLGVHPIGIAWAIGLSGLIGMLTQSAKVGKDPEGDTSEKLAKMGKAFALMLAVPLVTLFIWWLAHTAMAS